MLCILPSHTSHHGSHPYALSLCCSQAKVNIGVPVRAVAFSPNGAHLAVGTSSGVIKVLQVRWQTLSTSILNTPDATYHSCTPYSVVNLLHWGLHMQCACNVHAMSVACCSRRYRLKVMWFYNKGCFGSIPKVAVVLYLWCLCPRLTT